MRDKTLGVSLLFDTERIDSVPLRWIGTGAENSKLLITCMEDRVFAVVVDIIVNTTGL